MSGATATRATGCSWRRSSGSSAPARPGAIFPSVLAIGRTLINDFPDGPKAAFGRVYQDLSGRSGALEYVVSEEVGSTSARALTLEESGALFSQGSAAFGVKALYSS